MTSNRGRGWRDRRNRNRTGVVGSTSRAEAVGGSESNRSAPRGGALQAPRNDRRNDLDRGRRRSSASEQRYRGRASNDQRANPLRRPAQAGSTRSIRDRLVDVVQVAIDAPVQGRIDSTLVTDFTHQIINPLNGVVGTLDNLIDGTTSEERRPQRLRAARAQLSGAIELVRNLAYLSQLSTEAGVQSLKEKTRDCVVPELVIEAALFFQEIAEHKKTDDSSC